MQQEQLNAFTRLESDLAGLAEVYQEVATLTTEQGEAINKVRGLCARLRRVCCGAMLHVCCGAMLHVCCGAMLHVCCGAMLHVC